MSRRAKLLVFGLAAAAVVVVLVIALTGFRGVRGYLADNYTRVSESGDSVIYSSPQQPRTVYDDIRSAERPADTLVRPSGYYLRYPDDIVAVVPDDSGSRIFVDDEDRGFARWFPIIAPVWGSYGAGGFRGGGPGDIK